MNIKNKLYLIILLLATFSCEELETPAPEASITSLSGTVGRSGTEERDYLLLFENQMEWMSYLIARAVTTNSDARADFESYLRNFGATGGSSARGNLDDLVRAPSGRYTHLRDELEALYYIYQGGSDIDNCGLRAIGGSPRPVHATGGAGECEEEIVLDPCVPSYFRFISDLTDHNCLVVYMPYGFDPSVVEVNSTAHPLNVDDYNDSYKHTRDCVSADTMNPLNVDIVSNPLVIRPQRTGYASCSYDLFNAVDFEDYLWVD